MISYAAMLGTFCLVFFGFQQTGVDEFNCAITGVMLSVISLIYVNAMMIKTK